MTSVPLHPALVHLPIGLALAVPFAAVAVVLAMRRGVLPTRTWWLVLGLQGAVFGGGLLAFQVGERDEERVEQVVGRGPVHEHEERAEAFLWSAGATLAVAAAAITLPPASAAFLALTVAGSIVTAGLALYAGKAGGELVYAHGAARAFVPGGAPAPIAKEEGGVRRGRRLREVGRD
jgi:uncharacterized membrane protein